MAQDKMLSRIEAKLDALLEKSGIKPDEVVAQDAPPPAPRKLTPQEQDALDNAPPAMASVPPATPEPRTTAQNAPDVSSSTPKADTKTGSKK